MLRTIFLIIVSTHMEVTAYNRFEGGQLSALMMASGIDRLWIEQHITAGEDDEQMTTFKIETSTFLLWNILKFKRLVDKVNWENRSFLRPHYYDVKFMVPVRDSKEIEALA